MQFVKIENETRQIGKPANWDPAIHGECGTLSVHDEIDERGFSTMTSKWRLEPKDIEAILKNNGHVYLRIYGQQHPVICLYVGVPPLPEPEGSA